MLHSKPQSRGERRDIMRGFVGEVGENDRISCSIWSAALQSIVESLRLVARAQHAPHFKI